MWWCECAIESSVASAAELSLGCDGGAISIISVVATLVVLLGASVVMREEGEWQATQYIGQLLHSRRTPYHRGN